MAPPRVHAVRPIEMQMVRNSLGKKDDSLQMRMDIIRSLVNRGVDINNKNDDGETPLLLAVRKARLEDDERPKVSQVFFTLKNFSGTYDGIDADLTPFLPFFRLLLDLGADPSLRDAKERTPLFYATVELFPLLLQHGAALEDRDQDGLTPFLYAKTKAALALLKLGADPRALDSLKRNRWHYLEINLWEELAQKLSELRVNINQQDLEGRTPLLLCCQKEYIKQVNFPLIKFLVEHGADLALADKAGQTPLLAAARGNNLELMEWFLEKGAPVNVRDRYRNALLHFSRHNKIQVELLLRYKADLNIQDNGGNTILHFLAEGGDPENLELLSLCIKNGAAVNQRNSRGETPLAKAFNHMDLSKMKLLLENGADPNVLSPSNEHSRPCRTARPKRCPFAIASLRRPIQSLLVRPPPAGAPDRLRFSRHRPFVYLSFQPEQAVAFHQEAIVVFPCSRRVRGNNGFGVFDGRYFFRRRGKAIWFCSWPCRPCSPC